jgi:transaldolase
MTPSTPTCLWNESASIRELTHSIEQGAVGITCNLMIVLGVLKQEMAVWKDGLRNLIESNPASGEDDLP